MRFTLIIATLFVSAGAFAQSSPADLATAVELARANGCYSCHANAEKVVGPAFAAVAEKYASEKDAAASLTQSIQNGSKGKWGRIPMPAHPSVSAADLKTLTAWVLTVKP